MSKLAIIDGDALTYHSSKDSIHESIEIIDEKIQNIFIQTGATHYVLFISNSPYFRHQISSEYKSNRNKYKIPLKWLKTLKKYLVEQWGAQSMDLVESDDLCAYWMNKDLCIADDGKIEPREVFVDALDYCAVENLPQFEFESMEKVLCAVDKDLLQSIPGKHFNYTYKLEDKAKPEDVIKGWWVETTNEDAYINFWKSVVCGDATDNIKGIEGSGKVAFERMHTFSLEENLDLEDIILDEYKNRYGKFQGIYEFQKNYRLLHLLDCDEDFIREVGEVPKFPTITQVPSKVEDKVDDELKF